jgi:hypothetical protein
LCFLKPSKTAKTSSIQGVQSKVTNFRKILPMPASTETLEPPEIAGRAAQNQLSVSSSGLNDQVVMFGQANPSPLPTQIWQVATNQPKTLSTASFLQPMPALNLEAPTKNPWCQQTFIQGSQVAPVYAQPQAPTPPPIQFTGSEKNDPLNGRYTLTSRGVFVPKLTQVPIKPQTPFAVTLQQQVLPPTLRTHGPPQQVVHLLAGPNSIPYVIRPNQNVPAPICYQGLDQGSSAGLQFPPDLTGHQQFWLNPQPGPQQPRSNSQAVPHQRSVPAQPQPNPQPGHQLPPVPAQPLPNPQPGPQQPPVPLQPWPNPHPGPQQPQVPLQPPVPQQPPGTDCKRVIQRVKLIFL